MLKLIGALSIVWLANVIFPQVVYATQDYSWINDASLVIRPIKDEDRPGCNAHVEVVNYQILGAQLIDAYSTACIYDSQGFQVAKYTNKYQRFEVALRLAGDRYYRVIRGIDNPNEVTPIPNGDELFFRTRGGAFISALKSVKVSSDVKTYETLFNGEIASYYIEQDSYYSWLPYFAEDGQIINLRISSAASSPNGKYLFVLAPDLGHILINLTDRSARLVSRVIVPGYNGGIYAPEAVAVTNDGKIGLTSGLLETIGMEGCGLALTETNIAKVLKGIEGSSVGCKKLRNYAEDVYQVTKYNGYGLDYRWNRDSFSFTVSPLPGSVDATVYGIFEVQLFNKNEPPNEVSYIALGDSYSSGEGDATRLDDGSSFYLPGTGESGKCHLSSRSYPFLLAKINQLANEDIKSVACSGARTSKDYHGGSSGYYGQHNDLEGLAETDAIAKRTSALKNFSPGILKQIEFVKEHKPKVITVTGGGNDVGFGQLLTYCAMPSGVGASMNTCDQAVPNSLLRSMLGDAIQSQYASTLELIAALKPASEKTTIYIIGYPSFVSDGKTNCANAGFLNQREREVINQSVSYMNAVLRAAAAAGGAKFVDIETSLVGGRLCEGSEFVTGPVDVAGFDIIDRKQEMFHPNSAGHQQMALAISGGGFKVQESDNPAPISTVMPVKPKLFGSGKYIPTFQQKMTTDFALAVRDYVRVSIAPGYFALNKPVKFTMYSQPDALGTLVASSTGDVSGRLSLSSRISPGYHMLVAEGVGLKGEPTRLYQFVEVTSDKVNDRDGDGILDDQDRCQYVDFWIDENRASNVCTNALFHKPGQGIGNGYGHIIGNGSHAGHISGLAP